MRIQPACCILIHPEMNGLLLWKHFMPVPGSHPNQNLGYLATAMAMAAVMFLRWIIPRWEMDKEDQVIVQWEKSFHVAGDGVAFFRARHWWSVDCLAICTWSYPLSHQRQFHCNGCQENRSSWRPLPLHGAGWGAWERKGQIYQMSREQRRWGGLCYKPES